MPLMTVKDFLNTLDGPATVARELRLPYTSVWSWGVRNSIPAWRTAAVAELAIRKGIAFPASFGERA